MPIRTPKYRLHKGSGQALVQIDTRRIYLGKYGSPQSEENYRRIVAEWLAARRPSTSDRTPALSALPSELTINELLLLYWRFATAYYVRDTKPTKELACMKDALRPLRQLYGGSRVNDFSPLLLKSIQQHLVSENLSRGVVNHRINRIKRMFKWAVSEELAPFAVYETLRTVPGLRFGRTAARETAPVRPVDDQHVDAVLPYVSPQVAAMIRLQRATGMRSGEVVLTRACDIDMSNEVWLYEPHDHKNRWRGQRRMVPLGPIAQDIIRCFLTVEPTAYLFSPRDADRWRRARRPIHFKKQRKTPTYPSELRARERAKLQRKQRRAKRPKRERYDTDSYRRAIEYGIRKALQDEKAVEHWHPHQLRHRYATEVRKRYGIEAAQVALGHQRADVTQLYAEKNFDLAKQVAREMG